MVAVSLKKKEEAETAAVSGKFLGNGKDAKLVHAVAVPHEPWMDKEAWTVVLSEHPAQPGSKPDWDGPFGKLGAALAVSATVEGELFGTEVYHPAMEHKEFALDLYERRLFGLPFPVTAFAFAGRPHAQAGVRNRLRRGPVERRLEPLRQGERIAQAVAAAELGVAAARTPAHARAGAGLRDDALRGQPSPRTKRRNAEALQLSWSSP